MKLDLVPSSVYGLPHNASKFLWKEAIQATPEDRTPKRCTHVPPILPFREMQKFQIRSVL